MLKGGKDCQTFSLEIFFQSANALIYKQSRGFLAEKRCNFLKKDLKY